MKTMICVILDRSGSMAGKESDVIGGVNRFLEEQKKLDEPASIAFVRFDSEAVERFRQMSPLQECESLSEREYMPRGDTPLLDAVGKSIAQLDDDWRSENPDICIVVIVTDGWENASVEYRREQVKQMIKAREDSGKWAFIYLGANIDSFAEAGAIGINPLNTANYIPTKTGIAAAFSAHSSAVSYMRQTGHTVAQNLGGDIQESGNVDKIAQKLPRGLTKD